MTPVVEAFEARLLGPFTYHSVPDAGAAGATVTAPFLGDVALTYAIHYALHGHPIPVRFGTRDAAGPDYRGDYRHFATVATVGIPTGPVEHLPPEFVASSFMSEGYEQKSISSMESKHRRPTVSNTPYRPWRQIQSLAPSTGRRNVFTFVAVSRKALPERFTARIGLGRGTLLDARRTPTPPTCAVNRQTVESVLGRSMEGVPFTTRSSPLAQYQIHHGVPTEHAGRLLAPAGGAAP